MIVVPRNEHQQRLTGLSTPHKIQARKRQAWRVLANLPRNASFQDSFAYRLCATYLGEQAITMHRISTRP